MRAGFNKELLYWDKKTAKWSFLYSFLFMFLAHAYRFTNLAYTDDSVEMVQSTDRIWQLTLGRFLQPLYWEIRGDIVAPYLIGVLMALYLAAAVYMIVRLMGIRTQLSVALVCAVLTCNSTLSLSNATYVSWSDVYMLSLMFAVMGVYCWRLHSGLGWIVGAGMICASVALYQSYIQAAILLYLMVLARRALEGEDAGAIVADGVKAIVSLLAALIAYELCVRYVEWRTGITRGAETYNSIGNVGNYEGISLIRLLIQTYLYPFEHMASLPVYRPGLTGACYGLLFALTLVALAVLLRRRKLPVRNIVLAVVMTLLMPLGANAVYFLTKGFAHNLMVYSYFLFFVFGIYLTEDIVQEEGHAQKSRGGVRAICVLLFALTCYNHAVYANQMYVRRDLEFQSTLSVMTRVMDRAEQVEGYEPGYTPVAMVGTMYNSPLSMERPGFEHLTIPKDVMNGNNYATSGEDFYPYYFWEILGYPFNFLPNDEQYAISLDPYVRSMPVFPEKGCCQMIDGVMVIKLGRLAPLGGS